MTLRAVKRELEQRGYPLAVIWGNEIEGGGFRHNVQIRRLYKDGDDWKDSDSFGRDDLPLVAKIADMAHTWIFDRAQDNV